MMVDFYHSVDYYDVGLQALVTHFMEWISKLVQLPCIGRVCPSSD